MADFWPYFGLDLAKIWPGNLTKIVRFQHINHENTSESARNSGHFSEVVRRVYDGFLVRWTDPKPGTARRWTLDFIERMTESGI